MFENFKNLAEAVRAERVALLGWVVGFVGVATALLGGVR